MCHRPLEWNGAMISGLLKCNVVSKKREFGYVTVEEIFLLCFRQMVYVL